MFSSDKSISHEKITLLCMLCVFATVSLVINIIVLSAFAFSQICIYLQWTSDKDIICMAQTLGVRDITDIKFAENKVNGQSRG